jgi:hypothetical protein
MPGEYRGPDETEGGATGVRGHAKPFESQPRGGDAREKGFP